MEGHYILCGSDEVSDEIIQELKREKKQYVLMDEDMEFVQSFIEKGYVAYHGSSVNEEDLRNVGIKQAAGLVAVHKKDVDNIVTILTARELNKEINMVSLAHDRRSEEKLKRVGANNVLSTAQIGGRRLAALLTKPNIISFLDVITKFGGVEIDLEEIPIKGGSLLDQLTLAEAMIPAKTGLIVFAVNKQQSEMVINPSGVMLLEENDVLLVMGSQDQIGKLMELAGE